MQIIKGKHAVMEALRSKTPLEKIVIQHSIKQAPQLTDVLTLAHAQRVKVHKLSKKAFKRIMPEGNHQSVVAYGSVGKKSTLDDLCLDPSQTPIVLCLDHIEDPFNFGAILRTCASFGIQAIIYPKDRHAQLSPGVIKASSGGIHHVSLIKVTNILQALNKCKEAGFWIYATDVDQGQPCHTIVPNLPLVLVVGNEHKGVSKGVIKAADDAINIPLTGPLDSLNVSVATGILLHSLSQHIE